MRSLILAVCLTAGCAQGAVARDPAPYNYSIYDAEDGVSSISIRLNPSAVYVGHAGRGAHVCSETEEFYCVESVVLNFAVPKKSIHAGSVWKRKAATYKVLRADEVSVFGKSSKAYVIEQVVGTQLVAIFLYSEEDGLVGFSLTEGNSRSPTYLLREEKGFPFR